MATFGSGINPALGRQDFSGIQQGANAAAQGILMGGQGIARGIGQVGDYLEKMGEKWDVQRKENRQKEAVVKDSIKFIETMQKLPGISGEVKQMSGALLDSLLNSGTSLEDKFTTAQGASQKLNFLIGLGQQTIENNQKQEQINIQRQAQVNDMMKNLFGGSQKAVDPTSFRSTDEEGNPIEVTVDKLTGREISRGPINDNTSVTVGTLEPGTAAIYNKRTNTVSVKTIGENPAKLKKQEAAANADSLLDEVTSDYQELSRLGAIRDASKSPGSNVSNYLASTPLGQEFGKIIGSKEQAVRDKINQAVPLLIQDFKNATGMTAQQMNSDKDVKLLQEGIGNASVDISVALSTMRRLKERMGTGEKKTEDFDSYYNSLPPGAVFTDPQGNKRRKPNG